MPRIPSKRFTSPRHQIIFAAITDQARAGKPYDLMSVTAALKHSGLIEEAGGPAYLSKLEGLAGPVSSLDYYVECINHSAARRTMVAIGRGMERLADDDPDDLRPVDARFRALLSRAEAMAAYSVNGTRPAALTHASMEDLIMLQQEPIPWAISPWLARGDIVCLAGEPGLGKSWAALDLACALSMGKPWLGSLPVAGGPYRVMYVDEENNPRLIRYRVRKITDGLDVGLDDVRAAPLRYYSENRLNLDAPDSLKALLAEVRAFRPDFIILDSFVRFHRRDENSNSDMAAFQSQVIRLLAAESGAGVVLIHHLSKPTKDRPAGDLSRRVRGASDIVAAMDQVWGLERGNDCLTMRHEKCRWADTSAPVSVTLEDVHGGNGVRLVAGRSEVDAQDIILEALEAAQKFGMSRQRILDLLSEEGIKADARTATRTLGKLYHEGRVKKLKDRKTTTYWLAQFAPAEAE